MIHINLEISYLEIYLIFINMISFTLYAYDKIQAIKDMKRISENKLLCCTFIGGSLGSIISMLTFRHKVKKLSFMIKFSIVIVVQVGAMYFYINKATQLL